MWMLCALVLTQAQYTPPPLVPADPSPPTQTAPIDRPPPPPPPNLEGPVNPPPNPGRPRSDPSGINPYGSPSDPVLLHAEPFQGKRVVLSGLTGVVISFVGLGGSILIAKNCSFSDGLCNYSPYFLAPLSFLLSATGAYLVHRALDGLGSFGSSVGGMGIGAGISVVAWLVAFALAGGISDEAFAGLTTLTAVVTGASTALMLEGSNARTIDELRGRVMVQVMPVHGHGIGLALAGSF